MPFERKMEKMKGAKWGKPPKKEKCRMTFVIIALNKSRFFNLIIRS